MIRLDPVERLLHGKPPRVQRAVLLLLTIGFVSLLEAMHLPAALMLGALIAGVVLSVCHGHARVPRAAFLAAQGLIGCLVAHSIGPGILDTMLDQWPVLLLFVCAVILFSTVLGGLLAWWKVLPGSTAIWGSSPGGASVMVIMSEAFGADIRLVAFMQYLRVAFVAAAASAVARIWLPTDAAAVLPVDWFPALQVLPLAETLGIALGGAWLGTRLRLPAGAFLVPMFLALGLSNAHHVTLALPAWLMAIAYTVIGWSIGLRFTREVVKHAARAFPRIAVSTAVLIALCGGLAYLLHLFSGVDPLTAYLATSPGGADSVAIIAASSHVDVPFVMALQTARFLIVMAVGPALARIVSAWLPADTPARG